MHHIKESVESGGAFYFLFMIDSVLYIMYAKVVTGLLARSRWYSDHTKLTEPPAKGHLLHYSQWERPVNLTSIWTTLAGPRMK